MQFPIQTALQNSVSQIPRLVAEGKESIAQFSIWSYRSNDDPFYGNFKHFTSLIVEIKLETSKSVPVIAQPELHALPNDESF